jgi:hypothetical protein
MWVHNDKVIEMGGDAAVGGVIVDRGGVSGRTDE